MCQLEAIPSAIPQPRNGGAYELKFLVPEELATPISEWARTHVPPDSHARAEDETYAVHSIYFDTAELDVYHRALGFRTSKFRIRRYGSEPLAYLERKSKDRGWVQKRRTPVPLSELPLLGGTPEADWNGRWFHDHLRERGLSACCQVSYTRIARVGTSDSGPIRLTLDRGLRCTASVRLDFCEPEQVRWNALDLTILELKFQSGMPHLFQRLIHEFGLNPASESKYRRALALCRG